MRSVVARSMIILLLIFVLVEVSSGISFANVQDQILSGKEAIARSLMGKGNVSGYYVPGYGVIYVVQKTSDKTDENIDLTLVQTYPEAISLYAWNLPSHDALPLDESNITLIFDGGRVVQAILEAHRTLPEYTLQNAVNNLRIYIDGSPVAYSESEANIAQFLTIHGRSRMNEYDPNARQFLGGYTKDKPEFLEAAIVVFQNALQIDPTYALASQLLEEAQNKLQAYHLYQNASKLISEHRRELERASRNGNATETARRSYWLWQAVDMLTDAVRLNPGHERAAKDLQDLTNFLASFPRLSEAQIAQMEEQKRREFIATTQRVDFKTLDSQASELKGKPVQIEGRILQLVETGFFTTTYAARVEVSPGSFGMDAVYVIFKEKPEGLAEDDRIVVYGIADGHHSYRSIAGWQITIPKIQAEYYDVK